MTLVLSAAARWARLVATIVASDVDPRRVDDWSELCGVLPYGIRQTCQLVGAGTHQSLTLGRLLRSVRLAARYGLRPCDLLEVEDPRTVNKMSRLAGISLYAQCPYSPDELVQRQAIVRHEALRASLAALLIAHGE